MEIQRSRDRQRLSRLARAYLSSSPGSAERAAAEAGLQASMRSPAEMLACQSVSDDHQLKREAMAARDAFEAATNGMDSPEAEAALAALDHNSVFQPWAYLARAIRAFQRGDRSSAEAWCARLPPASFPALGARLIAGDGWGDAAASFAEALFPPDDGLGRLADDMREALRQGLADMAATRAARLLRALSERPEGRDRAAALAILKEFDEVGADPDPLIRALRGIYGEREALRLVALYLRPRRPRLGLLYWLKAACLAFRGDGDEEEARAWIAAALAFLPGVGRSQEESDLEVVLSTLMDDVEAWAMANFPSLVKGRGRPGPVSARLSSLAGALGLEPRASTPAKPRKVHRGGRGHRSQLTLFPEHP